METRLRGLRELAMQKTKTVAGAKRVRSTSPPPARPPRSRSLSRSPSRSVSPPAVRGRSRSPLRVRRRGVDDATARDASAGSGRGLVDGRDDASGGYEVRNGADAGRARRHADWAEVERGRERDRRDRGRDRDWERDREWEREREREREIRERERYRERAHGSRVRDRYRDDGPGWRDRRGGRGVEVVRVERVDSSREERDARTLFVWQLSQRVNEDDVYDLFSRAGRVRNVRLIVDRRSQRHKGQGYVEYHDVASVAEAVSYHGKLIRGYPVAVKAIATADGQNVVPGAGHSGTPVPVPQPPPPPPPAPGTAVASPLVSLLPSSSVSPPAVAPVGSSAGAPLHAPPPAPPRLVSVEELAKLLNPNNLPIVISSSAVGANGSLGDARPSAATATLVENISLPESEQVPLPIPGTTPLTLPSALGAAPPQQSPTSFTRLYVGSVPFSVSEEDLLTIFSPFGAIASLQLQREASTGRSRGYGFVEFVEHASAKKALSLNGLVLANRALKVNLASSTSAPLVQPLAAAQAAAVSLSAGLGTVPLPIPGAEPPSLQNADGELDDGRDGGVAMNAAQRAQLMQRLSRGEDMGSLPSAANAPKFNPPCATTDKQSRCLLLSNMFDPVAEAAANPAFDLEVAEDVRDEVSEKYGAIKHLFVDKSSRGLVYLIFDDSGSALMAKSALNGRWFGGLCISAAFVEEGVYKERLPDAPL
jgi:RNA recognition motif-containing protein